MITTEMILWGCNTTIESIKEIYGKNLTTGEFRTFCEIGRATGLNPFLREIWAVKYGDAAASIFIGRDGYRKSAQAHHNYDYHYSEAVYENDTFSVTNGEINHAYTHLNRGKLVGAYCMTKRKSSSRPIYVYVTLQEYSTGKSLWNSTTGKQATMIKKVAEAQCLRMCFQELFGGTYHEEEEVHVQQQHSSHNVMEGVVEEVILDDIADNKPEFIFAEASTKLPMCDNALALEVMYKSFYLQLKSSPEYLKKLIQLKDDFKVKLSTTNDEGEEVNV